MTSPPRLGKILVVDDRADFRQLVAEMLHPYGAQICECEDGEQVLAAYRKEAPQCVVMDVRMRNMDGLAATRQLLEHFPEARVLIVSAHNLEPMRAAARAAGALDFLNKEDLSTLAALLHGMSCSKLQQ
jgi:two-component system, chemotaxis family, chemotaxis protein CheY